MLLSIVGVLVIVLLIVAVLFVVGMRTKSGPIQKVIKAMNRSFWNPRVMRDAGEADAKYSVIRHTGRNSGKAYETPVGMYEADGALWVVLPYGTNTDWYKNLVAAGGGSAVHKGEVLTFPTPEVVPTADVLDILPEKEHASLKAFNVDKVLRLEILSRAELGSASQEHPQET